MSSSLIVAAGGKKTVTLAASDKIAVFCRGTCLVYNNQGFPQFPDKQSLLSDVTAEEWVSSAVSAASEFILDNSGSAFPAYYEIGTAPLVKDDGRKVAPAQGTPIALDVTGAMTAAMLIGGIVTSAAAAVTGTLMNPSLLEAAGEFAIGDAVDWSIIKIGANTFTLAQSADGFHTIVGLTTTATATSSRWRTVKATATTYITYRLC
jgi:hypothetical protein